MRKTAAAAAMAASLTIGGGAGALLFAPDLVSAQTDDPTAETDDTGTGGETDRPEPGQWLAETIAPLVDDGTITQDQADAVVAAIQEAAPDRPRHRHHRFGFGETLTEVLGLSADELRAALRDDQTIADLAEQQGVSVDEVIDALVADVEEKLDAAVENGRLTEEEAADKLAEAEERIADRVNDGGEFDGPRGPHDPRGAHGPADEGDAGDAERDDVTGS